MLISNYYQCNLVVLQSALWQHRCCIKGGLLQKSAEKACIFVLCAHTNLPHAALQQHQYSKIHKFFISSKRELMPLLSLFLNTWSQPKLYITVCCVCVKKLVESGERNSYFKGSTIYKFLVSAHLFCHFSHFAAFHLAAWKLKINNISNWLSKPVQNVIFHCANE